jgi:20S proteasome subunit alpha 2
MKIEMAIHTALMALKEGFEGEMTNLNIDVGVVREDRKFQVITPA